jgi:hypothetical protein
MGARDLSVIRTPPPNRQPIQTEVHTFSDQIVRDAIEYEVYRGGQVFFIHNRVKDIYEMTNMLQQLCPKVDFGVAHGQMEGDTLYHWKRAAGRDEARRFECKGMIPCAAYRARSTRMPRANAAAGMER